MTLRVRMEGVLLAVLAAVLLPGARPQADSPGSHIGPPRPQTTDLPVSKLHIYGSLLSSMG